MAGVLRVECLDVFDGKWVTEWPIIVHPDASATLGERTVTNPYITHRE